MKKIVGYFSSANTWRRTTVEKYKKEFDYDLAIHYLKHEIFESVDREMSFIQKGTIVGFYSGIRFLFPEVSHLAHLYYGNSWKNYESKCTSRFMRKFKILYPGCGVYYEVFRHGLMHSHHPKWLGLKRRGWYISNVAKFDNVFGIFIPEFTLQVKQTIQMFIQELESDKLKKKKNRLNKFIDAMIDSGELLTKNKLKAYARYDYTGTKHS